MQCLITCYFSYIILLLCVCYIKLPISLLSAVKTSKTAGRKLPPKSAPHISQEYEDGIQARPNSAYVDQFSQAQMSGMSECVTTNLNSVVVFYIFCGKFMPLFQHPYVHHFCLVVYSHLITVMLHVGMRMRRPHTAPSYSCEVGK